MDLLDDVDIVSRSEMKEEAVRRMKSLNMLSDTIDKFKNGKLQMSENGILFDLPDDILKEVRQHEDQFDEVIYHVIHSFSNIGETYECIFIGEGDFICDEAQELVIDEWIPIYGKCILENKE